MPMENSVFAEVLDEVKEAGNILREQMQVRFPQHDLLEAFQLFKTSHDQIDKAKADEWIDRLALHLGSDSSQLRSEYEDLAIEIKRAKQTGAPKGDIDIRDRVLTDMRRKGLP